MVKFQKGMGHGSQGDYLLSFAIIELEQKTCFCQTWLSKSPDKINHFENLSRAPVTSTQDSQVKGIIKVKQLCCRPTELLPISWTRNPEAKMLLLLSCFAYLNKQDTYNFLFEKCFHLFIYLATSYWRLYCMQGTMVRFGKQREVNNVVSILRLLHPVARQSLVKS